MDVDGRTAAAVPADLKQGSRNGMTRCYVPKEVPHPQVVFAFGL
jgi:hypothetical protein